MRRYELIRVRRIERSHKLLHFSKWFHCIVLWLLTVSFVFPYIILCVINHRRARNKLSRSCKKEMSSCGLGKGALLKRLDSWKTFPSGLNICGKGRFVIFFTSTVINKISLCTFTFPFVSVKRRS